MNVLLLSDFSLVAINATHYAMDLLQDQQVNFHLLNIFDPDPGSPGADKNHTQNILKERVEKLQQRAGKRKHKISGHYSEEKLVNAARSFVQQHKIDLIVMGAVGSEQRPSTILGRHTFEIISKIKCNILAVAEDSKFIKPKKLLLPLDHTAFFGEKNIQFLKHSNVFKKAYLEIWEFESQALESDRVNFSKEIFNGLKDFKVNFTPLKDLLMDDKDLWVDVQNKFDLIILLGKNIRICNRLLHNKNGLYTKVPNQLPILIMHD